MKSINLNVKVILLTCFVLSVFLLKAIPPISIEEKVEITNNIQTVDFFVNKAGHLNARLKEVRTYQSKSNLPITINQVISVDDNSKIKSMWKKNKDQKREVKPIITDYEMDGIFHNDLKLCITEHELKEKGAILNVGFEKIFTDTRFLNALYFKQTYATQESTIKVKVPAWLDLRMEEINFQKNDVSISDAIKGTDKIYIFKQTALPAFSKEKGTPSRQKTAAHLILIPKEYQHKGKKINLVGSLNDLYKWYRQLVGQINNESEQLKSLVNELIGDKNTDKEKINAIYFWVQDNIRYIAFEDGINGFKPEDCQSVYQNRYGDCKGMANLTKEMLKLAGYDARLTWMGTRDIPYTYDMPSLMVDNHMICTVLLDGKKLYLDATQKYTGIEEYGYYIQEQEVLIEDGDQFIRDKIPLAQNGHYYTNSEQVLILENDQLKGNGKITYNGSSRIHLANYLSEIEKAKKEKFLTYYLSNDNKNVGITNINLPDWTIRDQALDLTYDISLDNQVIDLGKELYLNVEIDHEFAHSDMKKDRVTPYEFSDKYLINSNCEIQLPTKVSIDYLPETVDIQHDKYSFHLAYEKTADNTIVYSRRIELKETMLEVEDFQEWNAAIQQVKEFYEDQIILKKE